MHYYCLLILVKKTIYSWILVRTWLKEPLGLPNTIVSFAYSLLTMLSTWNSFVFLGNFQWYMENRKINFSEKHRQIELIMKYSHLLLLCSYYYSHSDCFIIHWMILVPSQLWVMSFLPLWYSALRSLFLFLHLPLLE